MRYRQDRVACPRCGGMMVKKHETNCNANKKVILTLEKRRFRCLSCGEVFTEPDEVFGARRRSTKRLRKYLGERAMYQTVSRIAKEERVSESFVRRSFTEEIRYHLGVDEEEPKTSRVTGLDEFSGKKRIFDATVRDLEKRKVLRMVEGCGKNNLEKYFTILPEIVEVAVMDMHEPFRQAVQMCLPRANIVVDKFHVIRRVDEVLDKVRTRLQSKESKCRRGPLFHNRYLLLRKVESLSYEEQLKLGHLLSCYPELARGWSLKDSLRGWYKSLSRHEAEASLCCWEDPARRSRL